ncbi:MAG TPA: hypothetical protein VF980_06850 [Thermoanaerobaculia bacterium]
MSNPNQARSAARFVSDETVPGIFAAGSLSQAVTLRDVSVNGAQIEHSQPVRPAMQGRITIGDLTAAAVVIWTRLTSPGHYRSGLRIEESLDVVAAAIRELLARGAVRKVENPKQLHQQALVDREKSRAKNISTPTSAVPPGPSARDVMKIREARKWMQSHPEDAVKWYLRARATASEDHLTIAGTGRINREDVLAVWEFLGRGVDLRDVVKALE